jgi:transposase InsO family protein
VTVLCRGLGVSRSGFYAWCRRVPSAHAQTDARLLRQLRVLHADSRGTYGRPRLQRALHDRGVRVGPHRVRRLMRVGGLVARGRRVFRVTTGHRMSDRVAPDRVQRRFVPATLNAIWAGDITACWTSEGWCYLAVVLDLKSRRVLGWVCARTLDADLVRMALQHALQRRRPHRPAVFHSDQGTQYASRAFTTMLETTQIIGSMSRRGNCWDNAPVESFFKTLKAELWPRRPWSDVHMARRAIADYIDQFYNRRRLHSSIGYRSPVAYEHDLTTAV